MSQIAEPTTRVTVAEFDQLPETTQPTELLDGEIVVSPAPLVIHQRTLLKVIKLIQSLTEAGEILVAPLDVQLDEHNVVQPDLLWIADGNPRVTLTERRVVGPPDLVVEIVSKATERRDRVQKFQLYEKHGVREYWIVDLKLRAIQVWSLVEPEFVGLGMFAVGETFDSVVLGKLVEVERAFPPAD